MKRLVLFAMLVWMIASNQACAQDKKPADKDLLPPPKELPSMPPLPYAPPIYLNYSPPQLGQRNVWELYSVNSRGQFVLRRPPAETIRYVPQNYYYVPNGQPLPAPTPTPLPPGPTPMMLPAVD
jgi:hypothetical protein